MLPIIGPIVDVAGKILDKVLPDKMSEQEKADVAARMQAALIQADWSVIQKQADVIMTEATGESWLQRNWRPVLMLWFAGLVGALWLGFTAPNLSDEVVASLLDIVRVGVGGYVIGRTGEKMIKTWKS